MLHCAGGVRLRIGGKGRWWHFLWPIHHHPIALTYTWFFFTRTTTRVSNTFFYILIILTSRWRGRNHLSYLRAKSHYDSQPGEASEHPLIYDDANIHFYRGNNAYLLEPGNRRGPAAALLPASESTGGLVRDTSGLSQQVRSLGFTFSQ